MRICIFPTVARAADDAVRSYSCVHVFMCTRDLYTCRGNEARRYVPHEMLLGILRVSNPAIRKDLDRTWGGSGTIPKCRVCSR